MRECERQRAECREEGVVVVSSGVTRFVYFSTPPCVRGEVNLDPSEQASPTVIMKTKSL